ncbi:UPF0182 family protein, partial [Alicyclobacillus cellulosilyticus]|uniref:UPF0182 family protein n=1 Tax=Alicyclobacillus cellulosilyticus TaxID=1003997 RepID=UPI00166A505D
MVVFPESFAQPFQRWQRRVSRFALLVFLLIVLISFIQTFLHLLFLYREHAALGYGFVYLKNLWLELAFRYGGAIVYAWLGWVAVRPLSGVLPRFLYRGLVYAAAVAGWGIGYGMWTIDASTWYAFFQHVPFHRRDPLLHLDDAFYVYDLPVLTGIVGRLLGTAVLFAVPRVVALLALFARQAFITAGPPLGQRIAAQVRVLMGIGAFIFLCLAALAWLARYELLLTSGNGTFLFGPDFVTARLTLPVFSRLEVLALLVVAAAFAVLAAQPYRVLALRDGFVRLRARGWKLPIGAFAAYVGLVVVRALVNGLVNGLYVHPNQNIVELPYIGYTIDATRWAVGIDHVTAKPFVPSDRLTAADVAREKNALDNVRVNDQGQTTAIFNQLQSFKSYFQFTPAQVDRYGQATVYSSVREMNVDQVPVQTWVNRTLVYTHGYGIAISPVNQFTADGLPVMWAKNTPQETQPPIPRITRPEIYFGLMDNDVIAPSKQPEFDYPVGSEDHASHYQGGYGLPVYGNRWLLTLELGTLRFYTSDQLTTKSLYLFDRNIYRRAADIAPFLRYDHDAFAFIDGRGHIQWMFDAYTQTPNIPYAQPEMGTAYIRNSVKVVVDAYTGKTTFYVVDPTDPLIRTWMRIYPGLFTTKVPADVAAHFRYPTDLFQVQAQALTRYHMTDPAAFYNQEDLWAIANQIYQQNQVTQRPPVYQEIRMPDQARPHFVVSVLFTPANKDNLNGWFIADNEPGSYGRLTLYQFPQSEWVTGPMQAENQIDANPAISQQLTLWNQQGSQVVRGDLLLIPVGRAVLYIEPVYLVANRQNSLPQLQRVIIDFNQQVYMDTSLSAALQDLLAGNPAGSANAGGAAGGAAAGQTGAGAGAPG